MTENNKSSLSGLTATRIQAFSDGVFSIVITLLVIDLKIPQLAGESTGELGSRLFELWPKLLSYVLSFIIVGVYWVMHHHVFHYIQRTDRIALWLNIFFLMSVAFVPFPTALLGEYGGNQLVVIIYGVNVMVARILLLVLWLYATHRHALVNAELKQTTIQFLTRLIVVPVGIYILAIGLSFWNPRLSLALYIFVPVAFSILPNRLNKAPLDGGCEDDASRVRLQKRTRHLKRFR